MQFFDGKAHAQLLETKISDYLKSLKIEKELAIVVVGDDSSSIKFAELKINLCERFNIPAKLYCLSKHLSDDEIFRQVIEIFENPQVGGGIIQLPLPRESLSKVLERIPEEKDVDLLSPASQKRFYSGDFSKLPPIVRAFEYFLENSNIDPNNLGVKIIGKGFLVGRPLERYLNKKLAKTQFILDYKTTDPIFCQLLVLSAGSPGLVRGESLVQGCSVVDFGSTVVNNNTIGDLDLKSKIEHLGTISPSPGGMGPLVVRFLVMNFLGI